MIGWAFFISDIRSASNKKGETLWQTATAINSETTRSFAFARLVRLGRAYKSARHPQLPATEGEKAGRASAEFRSRYPIPVRGTAGSFIILEQLRDGKMVKNIFPKIGGRLKPRL